MVMIVVMVVTAAAIVVMMFVVVTAATIMIVVVMIVATAAILVMDMTFCNGLPAVIAEYHADFIYDENFLFFGGSLVNGFHHHIHHIMDRIDRGQSTGKVLHRQFSCLSGQGIEMVSCFL